MLPTARRLVAGERLRAPPTEQQNVNFLWASTFSCCTAKKYILNIYIFLHTEELLRTITTEAIQSTDYKIQLDSYTSFNQMK